jgi:hypothetical protein
MYLQTLCKINEKTYEHKNFRNYADAVYPLCIGGLCCKFGLNCVVNTTEIYVFSTGIE